MVEILAATWLDALTALKRTPGCIQIPDITKPAFNVKTFQSFVVVLVSQQHPDPDAVVEQPAHQIGRPRARPSR